jgi:hypothetical protein
MAVLFCSTSDHAFGPVFSGECDGHDVQERIEAFVKWLPSDARTYDDGALETKYIEFLAQEADYWRTADAPACEECGVKVLSAREMWKDRDLPLCDDCAKTTIR